MKPFLPLCHKYTLKIKESQSQILLLRTHFQIRQPTGRDYPALRPPHARLRRHALSERAERNLRFAPREDADGCVSGTPGGTFRARPDYDGNTPYLSPLSLVACTVPTTDIRSNQPAGSHIVWDVTNERRRQEMCISRLFGNGDCSWILFIIILLLLCDDDCGNDRSGCGCGC